MAHKNSLLTKRREPKLPNSACAEFANQNAEFHWRLWHLKNSDFPNAPSQSLRIQLALNSLIRTPVPKAETGILSKNSASPNSGVLAQGVGKTGNRQTLPEFCFAEFWSFCTGLLVKQELPDAKARLSLEV